MVFQSHAYSDSSWFSDSQRNVFQTISVISTDTMPWWEVRAKQNPAVICRNIISPDRFPVCEINAGGHYGFIVLPLHNMGCTPSYHSLETSKVDGLRYPPPSCKASIWAATSLRTSKAPYPSTPPLVKATPSGLARANSRPKVY